MLYATWLRRAGWLGTLGVAVLLSSSARADDDKPADDKVPPAKKELAKEIKKIKDLQRRFLFSQYQLGVRLGPVPAEVRERVQPKGDGNKETSDAVRAGTVGVLVNEVVAGGPAEKAGLQPGDILLGVGGKDLRFADPFDVMQAVNESNGSEIEITLFRDGEQRGIKIKPEQRTLGAFGEKGPRVGDIDVHEMEQAIREKLKRAGVDLRLQFIQPGRIFPQGKDWNVFHHEFPDDLSVTIHKEGNKPADVEVKRGDKTWTAKENQLGELPEDVREHVEALLGKNGGGRFMLRLADPLGVPRPPGPPRAEGPGPDGPDHGPADRPPRPEGPDGGRGRRPPRPDRPDDGPGDRAPGPPRAERRGPEGPERGPGDRPPRADGPGRGRNVDGPGQGPGRPDFHPRLPQNQQRVRDKGSLEQRLDALSRGLEEMHREFDGLRRSIREQDRPRDDEDDSDDNPN